MSTRKAFQRFAESVARYSGRPLAFVLAVLTVVAWAVTGPMFHFGDTWQLVINTGTTIVTFLMVFLIQNTQNRDSVALQIKLDELIRSSEAHNALLDLERLDDVALERIRQRYCRLAEAARPALDDLEHEDDGVDERVRTPSVPDDRGAGG
ncbi:low affinity iron permease family protein [Dyella sp. 20L07]|uniref:low affinity iron permease family protein n=1 Tax=Dyella sp. 20L07 TaxID=3384240 RepID=UPI003D2754B6